MDIPLHSLPLLADSSVWPSLQPRWDSLKTCRPLLKRNQVVSNRGSFSFPFLRIQTWISPIFVTENLQGAISSSPPHLQWLTQSFSINFPSHSSCYFSFQFHNLPLRRCQPNLPEKGRPVKRYSSFKSSLSPLFKSSAPESCSALYQTACCDHPSLSDSIPRGLRSSWEKNLAFFPMYTTFVPSWPSEFLQ